MRKSANALVLSGLIALITFCSGQGFHAAAEEKLLPVDFTLTSTTISGGEAPWYLPPSVNPPGDPTSPFPGGDAGFSANYISVVPEPTVLSLTALAAFVSLATRKRNGSSQ